MVPAQVSHAVADGRLELAQQRAEVGGGEQAFFSLHVVSETLPVVSRKGYFGF